MKPEVDPLIERVALARKPGALMAAWQAAWESNGFPGSPKKHPFAVVETHYRPFVRARVFFEGVRPGKPRRRYFFAQLFPDLAQAEARLAQARLHKEPRRTTGPSSFLVPEWCAVVWELPGGPKLRIVRSFMQRKAFRRTLDRMGVDVPLDKKFQLPQLLRYVPRKRAVFRWPVPGSSEVLFIKLYEPGGDQIAVHNLNWLRERATHLSFDSPEARQHFVRRRAVFMQGLEGEVLSSQLNASAQAKVFEVGRALASLHGLEPKLERTWSSLEELGALQRAMGDVEVGMPVEASQVTELVARLAHTQSSLKLGPGVPIHGNFFGDQVLVQEARGAAPPRVGIVDWDDLTLGDGEFDVGRMIAHIRYVHWQENRTGSKLLEEALLAGYRAGGGRLDARRLDWYVAVCLLMRAKISGLRKLAPGWHELAKRTLDESARVASQL